MDPLTPYIPVAAVLLLAGLMAAAIPALTTRLGPRSLTPVKSETFEGGNVPIGSARQRFAVKFYVVALLFIVFDVEAVFLYPWAVNFQALGWFGYGTMAAVRRPPWWSACLRLEKGRAGVGELSR